MLLDISPSVSPIDRRARIWSSLGSNLSRGFAPWGLPTFSDLPAALNVEVQHKIGLDFGCNLLRHELLNELSERPGLFFGEGHQPILAADLSEGLQDELLRLVVDLVLGAFLAPGLAVVGSRHWSPVRLAGNQLGGRNWGTLLAALVEARPPPREGVRRPRHAVSVTFSPRSVKSKDHFF